MAGPCARRAHCQAMQVDYCPCIVRRLLGEYAELLEQRTVLLERHHGDATGRVRGKRPAHEVLEGQIAQKADIALALLALCAADREIGRAVARAHNLDVRGGAVAFVGWRNPQTGRLAQPSATGVGKVLWPQWRPSHDRFRRSVADDARRQRVAEMIEDGHEWMARWLGWRPGELEAA